MNFEQNLKNIEDENERKVAEFLNKIGFSFLASRLEFKKSEAEMAREIDLLFSFQDYLFIIEVSTVKSGRNPKIITFFSKWSKQQNLERVREKFPDVPNNIIRIFFDLSKSIPENKSQDVEEISAEKGNKVLYKDEFEKLLSDENSEKAINGFLN